MKKSKIPDLKIGDRFEFGRINGAPLVWLAGEQNHKGYPDDSLLITTEGTIGNTTFNPANPLAKIKERRLYGSNRYAGSFVEKLLNSEEFLDAVFNKKERALIQMTEIRVKKPEVDGKGIDKLTAALFLLSLSEVGLTDKDEEGSIIELFKNGEYRKVRDINGDRDWWLLRSAYVSDSCYVRLVSADGSTNYYGAYGGAGGLRPALNLNLLSDYRVSVLGGEE
jgi:hypothetical protein